LLSGFPVAAYPSVRANKAQDLLDVAGIRHPHHRRCGVGVGCDVFHLASSLDLVRRSEDGAVAEHVHVGDVGPKREHPFALNAIHQTVY